MNNILQNWEPDAQVSIISDANYIELVLSDVTEYKGWEVDLTASPCIV